MNKEFINPGYLDELKGEIQAATVLSEYLGGQVCFICDSEDPEERALMTFSKKLTETCVKVEELYNDLYNALMDELIGKKETLKDSRRGNLYIKGKEGYTCKNDDLPY